MEGWEDESPSDEDDITNIENELYSMFYYHSMSEGIPGNLSEKYDLNVNDFGVTISLKEANDSNTEDISLEQNKQNSSTTVYKRHTNDRYIDGRNNLSNIIETVDMSAGKECSDGEIEREPTKLPIDKLPLPVITPITEKQTRFQSMRYFSKNETPYVKSTKKYTINYNKNHVSDKFNKYARDSDASDKLSRTLNYLNKIEKNLNLWDKKGKNKDKRLNSIIKTNSKNREIVDLTQDLDDEELNKNISKKNKIIKKKSEMNVVTVSSDSGSDSESALTLSIPSESESNFDSESDVSVDHQAFNSVVLNTTGPLESNNFDLEIDTSYDWKNTSSPEGWTDSMKKFYNKPSKKLLNFDQATFLREAREKGTVWKVSIADRLGVKRSRRIRCLRCNEEGHIKAKCTKVFSCYMCGTPGHNAVKCPRKICLKCGSLSDEGFFSGCVLCSNQGNKLCDLCGFKGHSSKLCTDAWRSFASAGEDNRNENSDTKYCCNCAKRGHIYEDCNRKKVDNKLPKKRDMCNIASHTSFSRKNTFKGRKRSYSESNFHQSHIHKPSKKKLKMKLHLEEIDFKKVKSSKVKKALKKAQNLSDSKKIKLMRKLNKRKKRFNRLNNTF